MTRTFEDALARSRMLYLDGKRVAALTHTKSGTSPLGRLPRAELASYWLGYTERDRLTTTRGARPTGGTDA